MIPLQSALPQPYLQCYRKRPNSYDLFKDLTAVIKRLMHQQFEVHAFDVRY